ncbi:hypothetical protein ACFQZ4_18710 [Catellatospora coxensis]
MRGQVPARAVPLPADAEQALAKVKERNEEWEEEDARWQGDPS